MPNKIIECHSQTRARYNSEERGLCVHKKNYGLIKLRLFIWTCSELGIYDC